MASLNTRTRLLFAALALTVAGRAAADEIWVAPVLQKDMSGLAVAVGAWPVTPAGMARLAFSVPDNLQTFQSARIVLIAEREMNSALNVQICSAEHGQDINRNCTAHRHHERHHGDGDRRPRIEGRQFEEHALQVAGRSGRNQQPAGNELHGRTNALLLSKGNNGVNTSRFGGRQIAGY